MEPVWDKYKKHLGLLQLAFLQFKQELLKTVVIVKICKSPFTSTNLSALDPNLLALARDGKVCNLLHDSINLRSNQFSGQNSLKKGKGKQIQPVVISLCPLTSAAHSCLGFGCVCVSSHHHTHAGCHVLDQKSETLSTFGGLIRIAHSMSNSHSLLQKACV